MLRAKQVLLGVNIDHVATIRQARSEHYPSLERAAEEVLAAGADQITIHLREDRRHIQDADLTIIAACCRQWKRSFNLELSLAPDLQLFAQHQRPDWLCLVPEKRQEQTTEGGLDLGNDGLRQQLEASCRQWKQKSPGTKISLFVAAEATPEVFNWYRKLSREHLIDAVEVHTGEYAKDFLQGHANSTSTDSFRKQFELFAKQMRELNLRVHAGHGLTRASLEQLCQWGMFEEFNIGHWIVSEALFTGLKHVVQDLKQLIKNY